MKYSPTLDVRFFNSSLNVLNARDFVWYHILPYLCLLGIFTNILNTIVFSHRSKLKNSIYNFFLLHSVANLAYVTVTFSYFYFVRHFFQINGYTEQVFELYFMVLLKTVLGVFMMFIELIIAIQRLSIVANYKERIKFGRKSIIFFFVFSLVSQLPFMFSNEIVLSDELTGHDDLEPSYEIVASELGKTRLFSILNMILFVFRGILAPCLLLVVNVTMLVKYRQQLQRKATLKCCESFTNEALTNQSRLSSEMHERNEQRYQQKLLRASNNITRMVIAIGFMFISTNLLVSVTQFVFLFFVDLKNYYYALAIITNLCLLMAHAFNILIYYNFDKQYNHIFRSIFTKLWAKLRGTTPTHL